MPTNRPFLANFLAAFRAHSTYQKPSTPSTSPGAQAATLSSQTTHLPSTATAGNPSASNPRSIASKATTSNQPSDQPTSQSTTTYPLQTSSHLHPHSHTHAHPLPSTSPLSRSPGIPSTPLGSNTPRGRQRRGSDSSSSSGGFRDALGPTEKWYIGGRTAQGEERFYRLGMVTAGAQRQRSIDRLSL